MANQTPDPHVHAIGELMNVLSSLVEPDPNGCHYKWIQARILVELRNYGDVGSSQIAMARKLGICPNTAFHACRSLLAKRLIEKSLSVSYRVQTMVRLTPAGIDYQREFFRRVRSTFAQSYPQHHPTATPCAWCDKKAMERFCSSDCEKLYEEAFETNAVLPELKSA